MSEHIFGYVYEERKPPRFSFSKRKLSISDEDANEFEISETAVFGADVVASLTARIEELEQALKPFADEAQLWAGFHNEETIVEGWSGGPPSNVRVSDLRHAADVLNKDKPNG